MKRIMQLEAEVSSLRTEKEQLKAKLEGSKNLLELKTPSTFALQGVDKPFASTASDMGSLVSNPFQLICLKSPSARFAELKRLFQSSEGGAITMMEVDKPTTSKNVGDTAVLKPQEGCADSETVLNIAHAVQKEVLEKDELQTDLKPEDQT